MSKEEWIVRKLIVWNLMTLDGYFEGTKPWDLEFHLLAWGDELERYSTDLGKEGDALLEVSDLETRREGPSYSFLTLETLSEERAGDRLWFVMGADMAASLESWKRPERVVELARLAIARRPGTELGAVERVLERLGATERADVVEMPELAVSSTDIRRRVAEGRSIRYLVPPAVEDRIEADGLYREQPAA